MKTMRRLVIEYPLRRPDPIEQPSLLAPLTWAPARGDMSIEERFRLFDAANPQVYQLLRQMALELAGKGLQRIGVKMLWENLRYRYLVATTGDEAYRLNNVYTSRYARRLADEPGLAGRIELRELKAE